MLDANKQPITSGQFVKTVDLERKVFVTGVVDEFGTSAYVTFRNRVKMVPELTVSAEYMPHLYQISQLVKLRTNDEHRKLFYKSVKEFLQDTGMSNKVKGDKVHDLIQSGQVGLGVFH